MEELFDIKHTYKEYICRLRKREIDEPFVIIGEYSSARQKDYIRDLIGIELKNNMYNVYFSQIKLLVNSFMVYYLDLLAEVYMITDSYCDNILNKDDFMKLIENTIEIQAQAQKDFINEFLPIENDREQKLFDEIKNMYIEYTEKFHRIQDKIHTFRKKKHYDDYVKEHFHKIAIQQIHCCLKETHTFISLVLMDRLPDIRISLCEIAKRLNRNLKDYVDNYNTTVNNLLDELYDENKEKLRLARQERSNSNESAEVTKNIEMLVDKINTCGNEGTLSRLKEETSYWNKRTKDLDDIADILKELHDELGRIVADEERLEYIKRSTDEDIRKTVCCSVLDFDFKERKTYLKTKIVETAQCMITFFSVYGSDRIFYKDHSGFYYVDEYNHRIYPQDYAMKAMHIDCDGEFVEHPDTEVYFFDESGRYVIKDGKKIYQVAQCTSEYELGNDDLLRKTTVDCGHGDKWRPRCRLGYFDQAMVEILPTTRPINIKETLDQETVKYLWDSFGWILPEVLNKIGMEKPKNPIHILAQQLLRHKYRLTQQEIHQKQKEAFNYRANIYKKEKQKAQEAARLWKSKLMKRSKPEDSDDTKERAACAYFNAGLQYITNISDLYNN